MSRCVGACHVADMECCRKEVKGQCNAIGCHKAEQPNIPSSPDRKQAVLASIFIELHVEDIGDDCFGHRSNPVSCLRGICPGQDCFFW